MQATLLRSFIIVLLFWWTLTGVLFSLADPALNQAALQRVADLFPWLGIEVDAQASALNAIFFQLAVLQHWVAPVLGAATLTVLVGYSSAWAVAFVLNRSRGQRERGAGQYRDMAVTLGALPTPAELPRATIALTPKGKMAVALKAMPADIKALFDDVIAILAGHPEAYAGDGHDVSLLQHTVNVINRALEIENPDPLLLTATVAHDLGKITAFVKVGEEFKACRSHDKESARLLAQLPKWWALSPEDREVLRLAVKYSHSEYLLPKDSPAPERTKTLIEQLRKADGSATKEEKKVVLKKGDLPDMAVEAFLEVLTKAPLQVEGMRKGIGAFGWKQDNTVYLLENRVRDAAIELFDPHTKAALGGRHRNRSQVAPFTEALLKGLDTRGWLIKEIDKAKVPSSSALWRIMSGTKEFNGVFIVKLPEEHIHRLPAKNTAYPIRVKGPQFRPATELTASEFDLGALLKPAKTPDSAAS